MADHYVELEEDVFESLLQIAKQNDLSPEEMLSQAIEKHMQEAAIAGFYNSLHRHSEIYRRLSQ